MKKRIPELLIILVISAVAAILLPNYFRLSDTIRITNFSEFITWLIVVFIFLSVLIFSLKTSEKLASIPDGYHKLYNEQGQISKEGFFKKGKLVDGSKHIYRKNGDLLYTKLHKNGLYAGKA
jgi:hypothetical protein